MPKEKKFGTFGGVFTPSILTILGVIMYMRLPWIVGQAGIFLTIGIVLVAHIVSITTGLSVSSIATDKRVKAGGTYFIISRSLGLPIGGTLGIALFFGLSLSVSLYLIGFAESFLGFFDWPINKDTIRLTGTIAIIFVGTLTFISTSLAIKTQYFIMAAIVLSLTSIFLGSADFTPSEPLYNPVENMSPLIFLFAIFFPAVTGFEAGVSMSGDLENPKKSIPVGTISAIVLGVFVYIGLTFFFGYSVNAEQLINNPNILLDMSFYSPLVVAGIWGATLSSAIGSILGAPRILQAISSDKITPKIFAKGYGKSNEPRNALILTFIVAEAGILIGELNLIARVVSMFFITTYGFLNLSSALENWASTDFRPSFRIPAWISIVGSLVCFILMLELDFVALIGATLMMGTLFVYLKRKELTLESGDTWEGVWSSILRTGLSKLTNIVKQQRNWRPNIILFSGDSTSRPHLLEFGRWLVHKRGILSSFNLVENKNAKYLIPNTSVTVKDSNEDFQGVFMRQVEVKDIYEGMETITKVYGFAGLEPNSVMFGWARNSNNPQKFAQLITNYTQLDYNIFLLDYDRETGFGKKQTIDLWWNGRSNHFGLSLTLLKFLMASDEWYEATARICIIVDDSSLSNKIYKNMTALIEDQRIDAQLKIINNAIENKSYTDIIHLDSKETDLVILGLPENNSEGNENFIAETNTVIDNLKSVVLVKASSFFKPIHIGLNKHEKPVQKKAYSADQLQISFKPVDLPDHEIIASNLQQINRAIESAFETYQTSFLKGLNAGQLTLFENMAQLITRSLEDVQEVLKSKDLARGQKSLARIQSGYLFSTRKFHLVYKGETLTDTKGNLEDNLQQLLKNLEEIHNDVAEEIIALYERTDTHIKAGFFARLFRSKKPVKHKIPLKKIYSYCLRVIEKKVIYNHLKDFGINSFRLNSELQKLFIAVNDSLLIFKSTLESGVFKESVFKSEKQKIEECLKQIHSQNENDMGDMLSGISAGLHHVLQTAAKDSERLHSGSLVKKKLRIAKKQPALTEKILDAVNYWENNQQLTSNFILIDIYLKSFQNRVQTILDRLADSVFLNIDSYFSSQLQELTEQLTAGRFEQKKLVWSSVKNDFLNPSEIISELLKDIQTAIEELPEDIEIIAEESFQNIESEQFNEVTAISVNLKKYTSFLMENELLEPLQKAFSAMHSELRETSDIGQEVVRFINYNLSLHDEENSSGETLSSVIENGQRRLAERSAFISQMKGSYLDKTKKLTGNVFDKLNPVLVSRAVGQLKRTIRSSEGREYVLKIKAVPKHINSFLKNILVRLVYQRSESVLFAKKLSSFNTYQTETGQILEAVNSFTPHIEVKNTLPFYYTQLFLSKHIVSRDFLVERPSEMEQAARAVILYRQGYQGALLILGERYSGKSTLSSMVAASHFDKSKIFHVYPPDGGSIDLQEFKKYVSSAARFNGSYDELFNQFTHNGVFILHDLELWWQRSINGFTVIDEIIKLINTQSQNCFFIINSGNTSYHFMNRVKSIAECFIQAIKCRSFDAEDIQQTILLRHESSGLKFQLGPVKEERLSRFKLARLFNRYFDLSGGNIGYALYLWISNITKVDKNVLEIRKPVKFKYSAINNLKTDWIVWLQQFLLHKHLTEERFVQISDLSVDETRSILKILKRSGIIVEDNPGILSINPYMLPVINKRFKEMNLL